MRWVAIAWTMAALVLAAPAGAEPRHGLSIFGDLKYAPDFAHFDYVNSDAPKGGTLKLIGTGADTSYDSFNEFVVRGTAAQGLGFVYDSLMARALDEPDAVYGLIAETADVAPDKMSVTFKLRPEAKFADGTPVTAADVAWTFATLKEKGVPGYGVILRDVVKAEALDPLTVRYTFQGEQVRDLPVTVASLPVLPKAFYASRNFEDPFLEKPLGSGPYMVGDFKQGSYVTYERRDDYWAKDLPVTRGFWNFAAIRYEYFRDLTLGLEALTSGNINYREEFSSRNWATRYDVPAIKDGRIIKEAIPDELPSGMQGFWLNTRRAKFKDARVRLALDYAFDFEWLRKNIFYEQYDRVQSYFENSDLKAAGLPSAAEIELLEPWRGKVPDSVFAEAYLPPVSDGSGQDRKLLRQARKLLDDAGYKISGGRLIGPDGQQLSIEFIDDDDAGTQRFLLPYIKNLKQLGIDATFRVVDPTQLQNRLDTFDYDIVIRRFVGSMTPGVELRGIFGSAVVDRPGGDNTAGIADPAVDALVEKVIAAKSREALVTAGRALDRVLRAGHYWVPQWYGATHRVAYWDIFGKAPLPAYGFAPIETWWIDQAKAAKLGMN
ncbi:MAG: extracellular solute-binding protein [Hyphomicrobiaceae bacterium]